MWFISKVNFLVKMFNTKQALVELVDECEKESSILKEKMSEARTIVLSLDNELNSLKKEETKLEEQIEILKENIKKREDEIYTLHQLDNLEFVRTLISEKKYEMYKLDVSSKLNSHWDTISGKYNFYKKHILNYINFSIQEFAAKEGISYEKLKTALYEINGAWFETYNWCNDEVRDGGNNAKLLLTSFMMIGKKEVRDKKVVKEVEPEMFTYSNLKIDYK